MMDALEIMRGFVFAAIIWLAASAVAYRAVSLGWRVEGTGSVSAKTRGVSLLSAVSIGLFVVMMMMIINGGNKK